MVLELASLVVVGLAGTVLWVLNPEAAAIFYGAELGWSPPVVGLVLGASQAVAYGVIFGFGEALVRRWSWLARKVETTRARYASHLERNYLLMSFSGAVTGLPPIIALTILAGSFGVPLRHFLPVCAAGRVIRFTILAAVGSGLLAWWRG